MAVNVNVVAITGNLTKDVELRTTTSGMSVGTLRVAVNTRRKNGQTGEWEDKPNFFDVTVFGAQADNCAQYLGKGRPVAVEGRLEWQEWDAKDGSGKRQRVSIIANTVQFLNTGDGNQRQDRDQAQDASKGEWGDPNTTPAGMVGQEDDIPF